jgi:hypothetical protein
MARVVLSDAAETGAESVKTGAVTGMEPPPEALEHELSPFDDDIHGLSDPDQPPPPEEEDDSASAPVRSRNKGGRPRKIQPDPPSPSVPTGKRTIPPPPVFKFETDNPAGRRPADFFRYWNELDPGFLPRLTAYVYRNWPVISIPTVDKKSASGTRESKQIDKVLGEAPIRDLGDLLHRYGSGDYTIRLNDYILRKSIAMCLIRSLRDDDHPPVIGDLEHIVMDDPANQSYIAGLRMKGVKFPGDEPEGEDEDMSAGVAAMAQTIEKLAIGQQQRPTTAAEDKKKQTDEASGMQSVVKVMADAATKGSQIISDAVTKANEITAKGNDPTAMISLVKEIIGVKETLAKNAEAANPAVQQIDLKALLAPITESLAASREEAKELRKQVADMQAENLKLVRDMLTAQQKPTEAAKPTSLKDTLKEMADARDGMRDLLGIKDEDEAEPLVKASDRDPIWARLLLAGINMLPGALQVMSYNLAVAKAGGTPMPPQPVPALPNPDGSPIPLPPPLPGAPTPGDGSQAILQMLAQIRNPLLRFVSNGLPGGDFAELLIEWTGDPLVHAQLKEQGKEPLMETLALDPHIKQVMSAIPQRFSAFVDEFLAWNPNEEEGENETV